MQTYNELIANIADWLHRSDLTTKMQDFVQFAESRINADIRAKEFEGVATLATVASNNTVALPSSFASAVSLKLTNGSIISELDYVATSGINNAITSGVPKNYSIFGTNILLDPIPNAAYTLTLRYIGDLTPLTSSNQTNAVLSAYPDVYLHACLIYAGQYVQDAELVAGMEALFKQDVDRVNKSNWGRGAYMAMRAG